MGTRSISAPMVFQCGIAIVLGLHVFSSSAQALEVIIDDMIVQGNVCIGDDCLTDGSENLGMGPVKLKQNLIRVLFDDTSTDPGFAANDWQLSANEATGSGIDSFSIEDITGGNIPFTVLAGAPTNSLFVDAAGNVGLKTDAPAAELNIRDGDTPTILLEQDGSGGFATQTWGLSGNEVRLAFTDIATGLEPFQIQTGSPQDSLVVSTDGRVGVGTAIPLAPLHVHKASQSATAEPMARFSISDDSVGALLINNNSATNGTFIPKILGRSGSQNASLVFEAVVTLDTGTSPAIVYNAVKGTGGGLATRPLVVYRNNNVVKATIAANGDINATSFNPSSSREIKDDIVDLDSQTAADALRELTPVKYVYKDDTSGEKRVGFIAEDVPEIVANADRKSVPIMDVVALVTRVVKDQQQTIDDQKSKLDQQATSLAEQQRSLEVQQKTIADLMTRLSSLESRLDGDK